MGLALGNFLLALLNALPLNPSIQLGLIAGLLAVFPLVFALDAQHMQGDTRGLHPYLPFIVAFQIVSGLMYGHMLNAYEKVAALSQIELLFYGFSALAASRLAVSRPELTLFLSVFFAILAYSLQQLLPSPWAEHLSLYTMMIAAGSMDLFVLSRILVCSNVLRAYAYAIAALIGGIAVGYHLTTVLPPTSHVISLYALLLLNLAVLALFIPRLRHSLAMPADFQPAPLYSAEPEKTSVQQIPLALPPTIAECLSEQEKRVLLSVLQYKTYKEVGSSLAITEASVKTYMQRIYRKTGTSRRSQLLALARGEINLPLPSPNE